MSNDFKKIYDVSIDLVIENQKSWISSFVSTTFNFIAKNSQEQLFDRYSHQLSDDENEKFLAKSKARLNRHLEEQVAVFLRDTTGYRIQMQKKTKSISHEARIFESKQVTYWLSRLLGLVVITDENVEDAIDAFASDYRLMKSSTDVNLCLKKIGQNISSKYHIAHSSGDWDIQLGLLTCFKLWLCSSILKGSKFPNPEERFSEIARLYFDSALQKPAGGRESKYIAKNIALLDALEATNFSAVYHVPTKSIHTIESKDNLRFIEPRIYKESIVVLSKNENAYLIHRYQLILLNRWIEIIFPPLTTNQNSSQSLNKSYFLWIARILFTDKENNVVDTKLNIPIASYRTDGCGTGDFKYFGKLFSQSLTRELNEPKEPIAMQDTLLFSPLRKALDEIENHQGQVSKTELGSTQLLELVNFLYQVSADIPIATRMRNIVAEKADLLSSIALLTNSIFSWEGTSKYAWKKQHKVALAASLVNEHPNYALKFHEWLNLRKQDEVNEIRLKIREALAEELLMDKKEPKYVFDALLERTFQGDI